MSWVFFTWALSLSGCVNPLDALHVVAGLTAHRLCAAEYIQHVALQPVFRDWIATAPGTKLVAWSTHYEVDSGQRAVNVRVLGLFSARAVYDDTLGCVIDHGAPLRHPAPLAAQRKMGQPFVLADSDQVSAQSSVVQAALDEAFTPRGRQHQGTQAVVIVQKDRIIGERYAAGYDSNTPMLSWSVAKSITSALIGILVKKHLLSVDAPLGFGSWQVDDRRTLTADKLLRMNSGLALTETNSGLDPNTRMLFLTSDMAAFSESAPLETQPGTEWKYMSGNYILLGKVLRDAARAQGQPVWEFMDRELFAPLGMASARFDYDGADTPVTSSYFYATARDYARFGLLYLHDGMAGDEQLLPRGWVQYSTQPTPLPSEFGYGAGWWLATGDSWGSHASREWGYPADAYFARGHQGQQITIIPSADLVIARFGVSNRDHGDFDGLGRVVSILLGRASPNPN